MIKSYKDLKVFQLSYSLAMEIFRVSKNFPKEETYSLTDQIRRSSRSISANIVEGWAKRKYVNIFKKQLTDSYGSGQETKLWLDFAHDCKYLNEEDYGKFISGYDDVCKMLNGLIDNWENY